MSKPSHHASVVSTPKKEGDKAIWTEIGAVWLHKSGYGFDLVVREGISVSGRIVCTEPKKKTADFEAQIQEQIREMSSR